MIAVENISLSAAKPGSSRRDFLRSMVSAGAFVLAARYLPGETLPAVGAAGTPSGVADIFVVSCSSVRFTVCRYAALSPSSVS